MPPPRIHECQCPHCQSNSLHPDQALHRQMNAFVSRLDEQQRRWYVALESVRLGHGGDQHMSQITGLDAKTIRRGRRELENELRERPVDRVRLPGAGRPPIEKKTRRLNRLCST